jgi:hypothetical protein
MMSVSNLLPPIAPTQEAKWRKLLQIFRNEAGLGHGEIFTPTQILIVDIISRRRYPRTQLILPTQYGKSMSVADGVLLRIATHKEKWAIVAPTEDKARIIMDYIIDRIFDDVVFSELLEFKASKEKLKQERSKTRIVFRDGGEVRVYSGQAGNTRQVKSALMGFGAPNIILDEAGQISDELYATVKRMVGGAEGTASGSFLLEIGNPVYRNHFHRTWFGDRYKKIFVNDEQALAEGRYTQDFLNEMQDEAGYDWMYRCLFPEADEVLANGYRRLLSDLVIDDSLTDSLPAWNYRTDDNGVRQTNQWGHDIIDDSIMLGIDVAGGGKNKTKLVLRAPGHGISWVARTMDTDDLDVIADAAEKLIREWTVSDWRTVVDAGGLGHGLPAILKKRGYLVKAIHFGEKETKHNGITIFKVPQGFLNIRAWMYWEARKWLNKEDGKLLRDDGFMELKLINYKQNSSLNIQIEPKAEMIKRLSLEGKKVESPDTADAFVLTFVDTSSIVEEDDIYVD